MELSVSSKAINQENPRMAAPEKEVAKSELPDPKEVAKTYAEVAQRASKLLADHMQKQVKKGISAPSDELGIAQAFMDMMGKLLANPYRLAQAQMNLVWDYFSLSTLHDALQRHWRR
jgi:polyhydroxyalkanoate synthase subunit PhaC